MNSLPSQEVDYINRFQSCQNSPGCYEVSRFVDSQIEEEYKCKVGFGVLNNPKQTPCRHVFCKQCIMQCVPLQDVESQLLTPTEILRCPTCRREFHKDELIDINYQHKSLLDKKRIRCGFSPECKAVVSLGDIDLHEYRCNCNPKREVECQDCKKKLQYSALKEHFCGKMVSRKFVEVREKNQEFIKKIDKHTEMLGELLQCKKKNTK